MKTNGLNQGFTLLEVIISVAILVVLSVAASALLRNSFDIRFALSQASNTTQRLSTAMNKIVNDLEHTYFISDKDNVRMTTNRSAKTYFKIDKFKHDKIYFTTISNKPYLQNSKESELAFVTYEVKEDPKDSTVSHLYRGLATFIPEKVDEKINEQIIARNIKSFSVKLWDGDRWVNERWDSSSGATLNKLPHMISLTVEAWDGEPELSLTGKEGNFAVVTTVVYLPLISSLEELKKGAINFRWY